VEALNVENKEEKETLSVQQAYVERNEEGSNLQTGRSFMEEAQVYEIPITFTYQKEIYSIIQWRCF